MKKNNLLLFLFVLSATFCMAQISIYVHQKVGEVLVVPITNIDSVTYDASVPLITTVEVNNITAVSAIISGFVNSSGGNPVLSRGVCWSTDPNPTISGNKTVDGSGTGAFTSSITGLSPNTTYYVRSYATNSVGTAYGVEKSFTCLREYLSSLSLKSGGTDIELSPAFIKTTDLYTATVSFSEGENVTITPMAENANSTITVNGVSVASGASLPVTLSVGPNSITVTVYYGGVVQQIYEINVFRKPDPSLSSMILKWGTEDISFKKPQPFDPKVYNYSSYVDYDVDAVTVTPSSESSTSTIELSTEHNKYSIVSGATSDPISLKVGLSHFQLSVDDYGDRREYNFELTRRTSSYLSNVTITAPESESTITSNPTFSRNNQTYSVVLQNPQGGNKIHVDASLEDPDADMTYILNGRIWYNSVIPEDDGSIHIAYETQVIPDVMPLNLGQNVFLITVIPTDGGPQRVYTFNITRTL
jgi:hypothetical protein